MDKKHYKISFSLIEVGIAMAVLALVLAGMIGIFSQGFYQSKKTQEFTVAYSLAREKLEEKFAWPVTNESTTETFNDITYTINSVVSDGPCPSAMAGCPPNNELDQLDVTVTWGVESITLSSFKADY